MVKSDNKCVRAFAKSRKLTNSLATSVLLSAWNNPAYAAWIFMKIDIPVFFENLFMNFSTSIKVLRE